MSAFSKSQSSETVRALAEIANKIKTSNKELCCIKESLAASSIPDYEPTIVCDALTGNKILMQYRYDSSGILTFTYYNADGTVISPTPNNITFCPDDDYEYSQAEWFCLNGTSELSRTDVYNKGTFLLSIWKDKTGAITAAPNPADITVGTCEQDVILIPGCDYTTSTLAINITSVTQVGTSYTVNYYIDNPPLGDGISEAYILMPNGVKIDIISFGVSGSLGVNIPDLPNSSDPNTVISSSLVVKTHKGYHAVFTNTIQAGNNINTLCTNAPFANDLYPITVSECLAVYDTNGTFLRYSPVNNPLATYTLTGSFSVDCAVNKFNSSCEEKGSFYPLPNQKDDREVIQTCLKAGNIATTDYIKDDIISVVQVINAFDPNVIIYEKYTNLNTGITFYISDTENPLNNIGSQPPSNHFTNCVITNAIPPTIGLESYQNLSDGTYNSTFLANKITISYLPNISVNTPVSVQILSPFPVLGTGVFEVFPNNQESRVFEVNNINGVVLTGAVGNSVTIEFQRN